MQLCNRRCGGGGLRGGGVVDGWRRDGHKALNGMENATVHHAQRAWQLALWSCRQFIDPCEIRWAHMPKHTHTYGKVSMHVRCQRLQRAPEWHTLAHGESPWPMATCPDRWLQLRILHCLSYCVFRGNVCSSNSRANYSLCIFIIKMYSKMSLYGCTIKTGSWSNIGRRLRCRKEWTLGKHSYSYRNSGHRIKGKKERNTNTSKKCLLKIQFISFAIIKDLNATGKMMIRCSINIQI